MELELTEKGQMNSTSLRLGIRCSSLSPRSNNSVHKNQRCTDINVNITISVISDINKISVASVLNACMNACTFSYIIAFNTTI